MNIVQISDTHLSAGVDSAESNWALARDWINKAQPDLVVHTGDISLNGAGEVSDLDHARRRLDELTVEWLAVPGNHDIGAATSSVQPITSERQEAYRSRFGTGFWSVRRSGWHLIGIDCQTLASTVTDSEQWWDWLTSTISDEGPTALFSHRPLLPQPGHRHCEGLDESDMWFIQQPWRARLASLVNNNDVRLFASGHLHQGHSWADGSTLHVWAPTVWASVSDDMQTVVGTKSLGLAQHDLSGDGVVSSFITVPGLPELILGVNLDSPYDRLFA